MNDTLPHSMNAMELSVNQSISQTVEASDTDTLANEAKYAPQQSRSASTPDEYTPQQSFGAPSSTTLSGNTPHAHALAPFRNPAVFTTHQSLCSRRIHRLKRDTVRRNDLLMAVGFLELANACDFAANLWNEIPVPVQAQALMAVGGTVALSILYFAATDAWLSWHNTRLLLQERRSLRAQLQNNADAPGPTGHTEHELRAHLDINFREAGVELIDRIGMDAFLGFGALLVGVGTLLAIDGVDPGAYKSSNLLTGYIGNVPPALFGLANAAWSVYAWRRANHHAHCAPTSTLNSVWGVRVNVAEMLQKHVHRVKIHSALNGIYGIIGGVGSLMTADCNNNPSMVWGYVVLIPCVIGAVFANYFWRNHIGYDRDMSEQEPLSQQNLLNEVGFAGANRCLLMDLAKEYRRTTAGHWPWTRASQPPPSISPLLVYLKAYRTLQTERLKHRQEDVNARIGMIRQGAVSDEIKSTLAALMRRHDVLEVEIQACAAQATALADQSMDNGPGDVAIIWAQQVYDVIVENDIFAAFCEHLFANPTTAGKLFDMDQDTFAVDAAALWQRIRADDDAPLKDPAFILAYLATAQTCLRTSGLSHFCNRERYLLEAMGDYLKRHDLPESGRFGLHQEKNYLS